MSWLIQFVGKYRAVLTISSLAAVLLAALIEVFAAHGAGIADWYMHLIMWLLLLTYFLLCTYTMAAHKRVRSWINVVLVLLLSTFWIVIMASRIPPEKVVIMNQLTLREPLTLAWLSIVLLTLAALVMPFLALATLRTPEAAPEDGDG